MFRTFSLALVATAPVFAQYGEGSLHDRARLLDKPVSTGLVRPVAPDEALIDREAWLREPIPQEQVSRLRAGLLRPDRDTVWRENITLPSEESQRQQEIAFRNSIQRMQGLWRVQSFMVDGHVHNMNAFSTVDYKVTDTVIEQSELPDPMTRTPGPGGLSRLQLAVDSAQMRGVNLQGFDSRLRSTREYQELWAGPTANMRQAGTVLRNDPQELEALRFGVVYRGRGQAVTFSWDRYGESADPHNALNRPSERVVLPNLGGIEAGENRTVIAIRGIGVRGMLPSNLQGPLGSMRTVFIRVGQDERVVHSREFAPVVGPPTGDLTRILGLGKPAVGHPLRQPGTAGIPYPPAPLPAIASANTAPTGTWVVRPSNRVDIAKSSEPNRNGQAALKDSKRNIIPQMQKVAIPTAPTQTAAR